MRTTQASDVNRELNAPAAAAEEEERAEEEEVEGEVEEEAKAATLRDDSHTPTPCVSVGGSIRGVRCSGRQRLDG
jgi:hypothetical protein